MSTPAKGPSTSEAPTPVAVLTGDAFPALRAELDAKVKDLASNLYRNNGQTSGKDLDNWAEALAKFLAQTFEVREDGPWFHCNCTASGIEHANIQLAIDPAELLVHIDRGMDPNIFPQDGSLPVFFWVKWPQRVDPSTAAAYAKNGVLTIEVKKTDPPAANPVVAPPVAPKA
jgi:HSP20 family molecular chaperone IbpA